MAKSLNNSSAGSVLKGHALLAFALIAFALLVLLVSLGVQDFICFMEWAR